MISRSWMRSERSAVPRHATTTWPRVLRPRMTGWHGRWPTVADARMPCERWPSRCSRSKAPTGGSCFVLEDRQDLLGALLVHGEAEDERIDHLLSGTDLGYPRSAHHGGGFQDGQASAGPTLSRITPERLAAGSPSGPVLPCLPPPLYAPGREPLSGLSARAAVLVVMAGNGSACLRGLCLPLLAAAQHEGGGRGG